jgi:hypothetical protein
MKVWNALMIRTTSSKLSWYQGLSSAPGIGFQMRRLATLLLRLGPAKFARRDLICIRKQSSSSRGILDRHLPV